MTDAQRLMTDAQVKRLLDLVEHIHFPWKYNYGITPAGKRALEKERAS